MQERLTRSTSESPSVSPKANKGCGTPTGNPHDNNSVFSTFINFVGVPLHELIDLVRKHKKSVSALTGLIQIRHDIKRILMRKRKAGMSPTSFWRHDARYVGGSWVEMLENGSKIVMLAHMEQTISFLKLQASHMLGSSLSQEGLQLLPEMQKISLVLFMIIPQ